MIITWIWFWLFSLRNETSNLSSWWSPPPSFHLLTLPEVSALDRLTEVQPDIRYSSTVAGMLLLLSTDVAQEGTRARFSCRSWNEKVNPRNPDVLVSTTFVISQHIFGLKVFFHYSAMCPKCGLVSATGRVSVLSSIHSWMWLSKLSYLTTNELTRAPVCTTEEFRASVICFLYFLVWSTHSLPWKGSWNLSLGAIDLTPKTKPVSHILLPLFMLVLVQPKGWLVSHCAQCL